ncbi:MAG TPA: multicopper oxidase domain-containing protein [Actinomycetota bacterium]|nr:multicopper oxidase domain-containing protein [Actinomycetota bacterium]
MRRFGRSARVVTLVGLLALAAGGAVARSATRGPEPAGGAVAQRSQPCDRVSRSVTLFAVPMSRGRFGFGLSPDRPTVPGPTIQMTEGECLAVTLVNRTRDQLVSLHPHGVDYTWDGDGTGINSGCVRPGRAKTYLWSTHPPSERADGTVRPGSAGYWHYHDHCMGTPHGTKGIAAGLFGALIVRRAGDPLPDRPPFVVVFGPGETINLRKAPHTSVFRANLGERVEFVVIAHGDDFHTFHLHGHRWADNRTGLLGGPDDPTPVIDTRTVGPADSFGFQLVAGEGVGPAAWMYHCHVQGHADAGMVGIFLVRTADGQLTEQEKEALERWRHMG